MSKQSSDGKSIKDKINIKRNYGYEADEIEAKREAISEQAPKNYLIMTF